MESGCDLSYGSRRGHGAQERAQTRSLPGVLLCWSDRDADVYDSNPPRRNTSPALVSATSATPIHAQRSTASSVEPRDERAGARPFIRNAKVIDLSRRRQETVDKYSGSRNAVPQEGGGKAWPETRRMVCPVG